jgi:hypothetical protein
MADRDQEDVLQWAWLVATLGWSRHAGMVDILARVDPSRSALLASCLTRRPGDHASKRSSNGPPEGFSVGGGHFLDGGPEQDHRQDPLVAREKIVPTCRQPHEPASRYGKSPAVSGTGERREDEHL